MCDCCGRGRPMDGRRHTGVGEMGALQDRMVEDLRLRGFAQNTIKTYVYQVRKFVKHFGLAPGRLGAADIRR